MYNFMSILLLLRGNPHSFNSDRFSIWPHISSFKQHFSTGKEKNIKPNSPQLSLDTLLSYYVFMANVFVILITTSISIHVSV